MYLDDPVVNDFMATVITSVNVTLTWNPPTTAPVIYYILMRYRRVCESSFTSNSETFVSSPHTSTGIPPYSQCGFDLIGVYGSQTVYLTTNHLATTLFTGKITIIIIIVVCHFFLYSPYCTSGYYILISRVSVNDCLMG